MLKTSTCIYCGCGCKLEYETKNNKIVKIHPVKNDDVSEGKPCIKGLTINEIAYTGRIEKPLIRQDKTKPFKEVSWQKAIDFIYKNIKSLDPGNLFLNVSGKTTNEDCYVTQKFARAVLKTNNIDSCCGRLCHLATVQAMIDCFGNSNLTKMENINKIDTLLIVGSNPSSNYPVFFNKILARRKKIKLLSIEAIYNQTSQQVGKDFHDQTLIVEPGTKLVLLNGIINYLITKKQYDKKAEKFDGFALLKATVKSYTPEIVTKTCKIKKKDFITLAKAIAGSKNLGVFHGMALTQFVNAIENVHSLLNLVLLKNATILTLRGEINVQGAGDMGSMPDQLPNGDFSKIFWLEKKWKTKLSEKKGKNMIEALMISPVKAAIITAFNPAQSLPNLDKVHSILKKMFLVVLETHYSKTAEFANVILPISILPEGSGTITNGEKKVKKVTKVSKPFGVAIRPWQVFSKLAKKYNQSKLLSYKTEKQIFMEITACVPAYKDLNVSKIYKGFDQFADKEVKWKRFYPENFNGVDDVRTKQYPFILTTRRSPYQFLGGEATNNSPTLMKLEKASCVLINANDAKALKLKNMDLVNISSRVSSITANIVIDNLIPPKIVVTNIHCKGLLVNKLFDSSFDEETFTPNYKVVAVNIKKVSRS